MAVSPGADLFRVADLERLSDDWNRYEVIEGELFVSPPAALDHQWAKDTLVSALRTWDPERMRGRPLGAPGVIFSDMSAVIPDVVWVSNERWPLIQGDDGHYHGTPDLIVEVLSPGPVAERRDREAKLRLSLERGVREYWIVDRVTRTVEVYRRRRTQLRLQVTLTDADALGSPLLPGFALPVAGCLIGSL